MPSVSGNMYCGAEINEEDIYHSGPGAVVGEDNGDRGEDASVKDGSGRTQTPPSLSSGPKYNPTLRLINYIPDSGPTVTKERGQHTGMAGREGDVVGKAEDDLGVAIRTTPTITTAHPPIPMDPQPDGMSIHAERGVQVCEYVRGVCSIHGKAEKLWKPTKVWTKGNTGVFGWKYSRKAYYTCRKVTRKPTQETQPTFIAVGGQSELQTQENLSTLTGGRRGRRGYVS